MTKLLLRLERDEIAEFLGAENAGESLAEQVEAAAKEAVEAFQRNPARALPALRARLAAERQAEEEAPCADT